jgi:hypothetical protein
MLFEPPSNWTLCLETSAAAAAAAAAAALKETDACL